MEAECRRFHSYDFAADQVFQRSLMQRGEKTWGSEEGWLLETKIRYYSRFIKPIDLEDYKRWLSSQVTDPENQSNLAVEEDMTNAFEKLLRQTTNFSEKNEYSTTVETTKSSHKPCIGQQTNMEDAGMHFQISKEIKGKVSYKPTESSQKEEWPHENKAVSYLANPSAVTTPMIGESCNLSFPQVLHLVQNGQEIPGIQKLNIMSTNSMPTISQMARKPKPWESI
ncbi:uncharacterized protein LOC127578901 [Pristis pectinata]|uniref:uncharacterized protein LOC127578901 n=1 Tax=Pristis pectinata TaxID=685728 RepID=UPI00223DADA1|nr:uncharacterized protein LOC127578901 [Pristis pectinata]